MIAISATAGYNFRRNGRVPKRVVAISEQRESSRTEERVGQALQAPPRRDPFTPTQAALPPRPNYLPEEAEEGGRRSELWNMLKAILLATITIIVLGWLLARR